MPEPDDSLRLLAITVIVALALIVVGLVVAIETNSDDGGAVRPSAPSSAQLLARALPDA